MLLWLLGCVVLCLLGAGPMEAGVTQTPRYLITKTKKKLTVNCSQNMNHEAMFWYRQDPGKELKLIYYSVNVDLIADGDIPDGYEVSRKKKEDFPLTLKSTSTNQTSVYFCASSESTALHGHILSAQKGTTRARRLLHQEAPPLAGGKASPTISARRSLSRAPQLRGLRTMQALCSVSSSNVLYQGVCQCSGTTTNC